MGKRRIYSLTFVIITALFVCKGSVEAASDDDTIAEGVFIEHMDMSGMTYHEAEAALNKYVQHLEGKVIYCGGDEGFSMTLEEAGLYADVEGAVQEAVSVGRQGYFFSRWQEKRTAKKEGVYIPLSIRCDVPKLEAVLGARAGAVFLPCKDAVITRQNGQFVVEESQTGQTLNISAMINVISDIVENDWNGADIHVDLLVNELQPEHPTEEVAVISDLLGSYKTSFAGSSGGRVTNIKNGAAKLENRVVYPGEEFSFLSVMVPFSYENGYAMAGTYVNGKQVDGLGGGICQVSSTLYNAVLRAELTVTSRSNHMMTVGYVPLGADATIANPNVDFKFRNDFDTPVLIESYTSGTTLYVNIYGVERRPKNREVTFVSVVEETMQPGSDVITYDDTKASSYREVTQSAHVGYVAAFYKNVYMDGQLVEQTLVNRSRYGAYPAYVIQGTKND